MVRGPGSAVPSGPLVGSARALAVTLAAALASLLPVTLAGHETGVVSHLALAPIFAASIRERDRIGPVGAFIAGLAVDVMALAPLGVCAAAYLAVHALTVRAAPLLAHMTALARGLCFVPVALAVAGGHAGLTGIAGGGLPSRGEVAVAIAATVAVYPLMAVLSRLVFRAPAPRAGALGG